MQIIDITKLLASRHKKPLADQRGARDLCAGELPFGASWPYTDLNDQGLDGLFPPEAADELVAVLEEVRRRAAA